MKNLLFILFILTTIPYVHAQTQKTKSLLSEIDGQWSTDDKGNLTYQNVIEMEGIGKDLLYQRSENYFIYNYDSGKDVIQMKDKEQGLIIGKGFWPAVYIGMTIGSITYNASHILRVDVKDDKARITLTVQNYDLVYNDGKTLTEFSMPISNSFPININSKSKTMEGKAFYALHFKCISTIDNLINSLKNDAVQTNKNDNW